MKIGVIGCSGRMGRVILQEIAKNKDAVIAGGLVRNNSDQLKTDIGQLALIENLNIFPLTDINELLQNCDAVIDFSTPQLSLEVAKACAQHNVINIIGTTGFTADQFEQLKNFAQQTPILWSSNMSLGVNILTSLTEKLAKILDEEFDIEIVEMHHRDKVDAPSGTALCLGNAAAKGRGVELDHVACKQRDGIIGKRKAGQIGFATLRGGDVVGDHSVIFASKGERIELSHKASNRSIFASGAVKAALKMINKPNGFYSMQDILEID